MFLEAKALELIVHLQTQLMGFCRIGNHVAGLRSNEFERIRKAREILIRNLENPPSLLELARQVGTNRDKLNQEFRQIYGTSAFNYLRLHRLERARELLESREKNVTEVAFDVGYTHPKNFTRAFKSHFGINPGDFLR